MKKGKIKKLTACLLFGAMTLMSACGDASLKDKTDGYNQENGEENSEAEKDHIYRIEDIDLEMPDQGRIVSFCESGDKLYGLLCTSDNDAGDYSIMSLSDNSDSMEEITIESEDDSYYWLSIDEDGSFYTVRNPYTYWDYEEDTDTTDACADEEDVSSTENAEQVEDLTADEADKESNITALATPEIVKLSNTGAIVWEMPVAEWDKKAYIQDIEYCKGLGLVTASSEGFTLYNKDTGEGERIPFSDLDASEQEYLGKNLYTLRDGSFCMMMPDLNMTYKMYRMNVKKGQFEEITDTLPSCVSRGLTIFPGKNVNFLYIEDEKIRGFNLGDGEEKMICDLAASDLMLENIEFLDESDENSLLIHADYSGTWDGELFKLVKVPPEEVREKEELVLGTASANYDIQRAVSNFNQRNSKYRIKIKEYDFPDCQTYEEVCDRMNLEMVTGDVPDIMVFNLFSSYENYIKKGLIAPLDEFFEKDDEISEEKYLENVMAAAKRDGKIYLIMPAFLIDTCTAAKSMLTDETMTLSNISAICREKNVKEEDLIAGIGRDDADSIYNRIYGDFIDYENGTCSFNSPEFINLLEYIGKLPVLDEDEDEDFVDTDNYYREKKSILNSEWMSGFEAYQIDKSGTFGEDVVFNGYPGINEGKSYLVPLMQLALSTSCKDKEAGWEFLRYFLTDEYQKNIRNYFPVEKKAFDLMAEKSQEIPYYIDEKGKKHEEPSVYGICGSEIELEPLSKEEATEFSDFVKSVTDVLNEDKKVEDIIFEETGAYYEGQKSAEEVADIIQSRVSIYLAEGMD